MRRVVGWLLLVGAALGLVTAYAVTSVGGLSSHTKITATFGGLVIFFFLALGGLLVLRKQKEEE